MKSTLFALVCSVILAACAPDRSEVEAARMAELHANDTPVATGIAQEPTVDVTGSMVTYGQLDERALEGYLAYPSGREGEALPGLLIIHEWWGLNDNIKVTARRLAGEGYRILAVDLYGGQVGSDRQEAQRYMQEAVADPAALQANLAAGHSHLSDQYAAPKVGAMGWCFGGGQALNAALSMPDELDATVIYYGRLSTDRDALAQLQMPILGFFGADDGGIPVDAVRGFESTLRELGKDVSVHVYDGAGHAFANPSGQNYHETAATDSWGKTLAFFREHLDG